MTLHEQKLALEKAIEAIRPMTRLSYDDGVQASVWKEATLALLKLENAHLDVLKALDADMLRRYRAGVPA